MDGQGNRCRRKIAENFNRLSRAHQHYRQTTDWTAIAYVNAKKSACLRFGPRYKNACSNVMVCGLPVNWVTSARYLGVYLESSSTFKCSFQSNKAKFYKAFNCIFGKIGRVASEEVIFALMKSKCLPILLYGTEAWPVNSAVRHYLQFALNRAIFKIFGALSKDTYQDICKYFDI